MAKVVSGWVHLDEVPELEGLRVLSGGENRNWFQREMRKRWGRFNWSPLTAKAEVMDLAHKCGLTLTPRPPAKTTVRPA